MIRTFFKAFKLKPIPEVEITKEYVGEDTKYQLKTADIRKAISESRLTYQTLFLVLAQTGLSLGDALLLDAIDFIESVSERDENLLVKEELTYQEAIIRLKRDKVLSAVLIEQKNEFYILQLASKSIASYSTKKRKNY